MRSVLSKLVGLIGLFALVFFYLGIGFAIAAVVIALVILFFNWVRSGNEPQEELEGDAEAPPEETPEGDDDPKPKS